MSKGISRQQRRLLSLAAAVNRIKDAHLPDVSVALASVVLGGVGLRTVGYRHTPHLALDDAPVAHSIRTTTAKGCASLARRGLLVPDGSVPGHYGITAAGMALAEGAVPEGTALAPWLWLLRHLPIRRSHALDEGADPTTLPLLPGWSRTLGWSRAGNAGAFHD